MKTSLIALMTLLPVLASAQVLPNPGVDTVKSGMGEEGLAPIATPQPARVGAGASPSASEAVREPGSVSQTTSEASAAASADPFVVKGVVVNLSDTTGFDRDAALEVAARQALPQVLVRLGHTPDKADKSVKNLGDAMRFVKGYKVVKETLIPNYVLTADLTFNGPMVQKNFGGKVPAAPAANGEIKGVVVKTAGTENLPIDEMDVAIPAAANTPAKQWVVRIFDRDPSEVERVRANLNKQAGTRANYRLLTAAGAELVVATPLTASEVERYAGRRVEVVELEIPLPVAPITEDNSHPWQGQEEPSSPRSPRAPSAPNSPNSPDGSY